MAFRKTLTKRFSIFPKIATQSVTACRISTSFNRLKTRDDASQSSAVRRLFHEKAILQPSMDLWREEIGSSLLQKIHREMSPGVCYDKEEEAATVMDAKKLLKAAQLEMVKSKLSKLDRNWITYSNFVKFCSDACLDPGQGAWIAKTLDECGSVIVLGSSVFLKPEQVVKAIRGIIPSPVPNPDDPRRMELEEMEKHKAQIDKKAKVLVRRELWGGLGFLVVQTAGFMRLTFWELSWDVMEPICFYVTSVYFMIGYAFFLRTSKEPSFEGFYQSRLGAKQKRLMQLHNFDLKKYNQLKDALIPHN